MKHSEIAAVAQSRIDSGESPQIEYAHGHPWATVATIDKSTTISMSLSNLLYNEEGNIYLLAFQGEKELRFYIS